MSTMSTMLKRSRDLVREGRHHLPLPTGQYRVGCVDIMTGLSKNGCFLRLFYPTEGKKPGHEHYLWPLWLPHKKYMDGYANMMNMWPPLFRWMFRTFVGDVCIPAMWKAPPLRRAQPYPVIIFSHGLGGCRTTYSSICIEMASQGYIVAAVEHRDRSACLTCYAKKSVLSMSSQSEVDGTADDDDLLQYSDEEDEVDNLFDVNRLYRFCTEGPDVTMEWLKFQKVEGDNEYEIRNRQVYQRVRESVRALDLLDALNRGYSVTNVIDLLFRASDFEGLMDLSKVAIAGHSLGGATTIMALATELRFKVGIALDAWMYPIRKEEESFPLVTQPMLFVNMEKFQTTSNLRCMKLLEHSNTVERRVVTIRGTVHTNQSDIPFLISAPLRWAAGAASRRDRFTALDLTTRLMLVFLSRHFDLGINHFHHEYLAKHQKVLKEGIKLKNSL